MATCVVYTCHPAKVTTALGGMAASLQRAINPAGQRDEVGRERPGVGGVRLRLCRSKSRRRRSSGVCVLDENGAQDVVRCSLRVSRLWTVVLGACTSFHR